MSKYFYIAYGVLSAILIALGAFGITSWWVATCWLWFPVGVTLSQSLIMLITADIGTVMKKHQQKKMKKTCANCLYKHTQEILGDEKCMGEKAGAEKHDGYCDYHTFKK